MSQSPNQEHDIEVFNICFARSVTYSISFGTIFFVSMILLAHLQWIRLGWAERIPL